MIISGSLEDSVNIDHKGQNKSIHTTFDFPLHNTDECKKYMFYVFYHFHNILLKSI